MTPDDYAAIRAMLAEQRAAGQMPSALEVALLAEVDRLTDDVTRLNADLVGWLADYQSGHRDGRTSERARIRAAVEGLSEPGIIVKVRDDLAGRGVIFGGDFIYRAAVLAAIDGEAT